MQLKQQQQQKTLNVTELKKVRKKKAHVSLAKYKNRIKYFSHPFWQDHFTMLDKFVLADTLL